MGFAEVTDPALRDTRSAGRDDGFPCMARVRIVEMIRIFSAVVLCAAAVLASPRLRAAEKPVEATGWVSDEACGADHTKPGREDCVRKCLRGGASVGHPEWKPQRMVFVDDRSKEIWIVENPGALKDLEGAHVRVSLHLDPVTKMAHVFDAVGIKPQ